MKKSKTYSVPAIQRTLDIIESMASNHRALTITEANRKFNIPKSSVYAILQTLKSRGYVAKDDDDRYSLTLKLFSLSSGLVDSLDLRGVLNPLLKELTNKAAITGHISVLDDGYAVYIEKVEVLGAVRLTTWVGKRMPAHSTAIGKVLLAYLPENEVDRIVAERGLPRQTRNTITGVRDLKKELARIRAAGYSTSDEENEEGVRAVAAPIFDRDREMIAAVNLGGSSLQIKVENFPFLGKLVRSYAIRMSQVLGYPGTEVPSGKLEAHLAR